MDIGLLPRGLMIGFLVAAPVGPMAVLCIRRTLARGRTTGLVSGLGIATADALYGAVAAFGLTSISDLLVGHQDAIRLVGGLFLCYLGFSTLRSSAAALTGSSAESTAGSYAGAYASTLGLTLTNPATILSFAAIFAGLGVASERGPWSAGSLVIGVFAGSAAWWLLLTFGTGSLRSRLQTSRLTWANRISGATIAGFGVLALATVVR